MGSAAVTPAQYAIKRRREMPRRFSAVAKSRSNCNISVLPLRSPASLLEPG